MISRERLYELAFALRAARPWKRLDDRAIFGVTLSTGHIAYCCVMGSNGSPPALALYPDENALQAYLQPFPRSPGKLSVLRLQESLHSQRYLECGFVVKGELSPLELAEAHLYGDPKKIPFRGKNAFPQFSSYRPMRVTVRLTDPDQVRDLAEAISAALYMDELVTRDGKAACGFNENYLTVPLLTPRPEGGYTLGVRALLPYREPEHPTPQLSDELMLARIRRMKKTGSVWHCDLVAFPEPILPDEDADEEDLLFPYALFTADPDEDTVYCTSVVEDFRTEGETLLRALGTLMADEGKPARILIRDDRTAAFLRRFCAAAAVDLTQISGDPTLDDLEQQWCADLTEDGLSFRDSFSLLCEMLMELDDNDLHEMPDSLWEKILIFAAQGYFPKALADRILSLDR